MSSVIGQRLYEDDLLGVISISVNTRMANTVIEDDFFQELIRGIKKIISSIPLFGILFVIFLIVVSILIFFQQLILSFIIGK